MKKRILSLVLCAAMLLSMCLFLGAGVAEDTTADGSTESYIPAVNFTNVAPFVQANAQAANGPARAPLRAANANNGSTTPTDPSRKISDAVVTEKTATPNADGTYTIKLTSYTTGTVTEQTTTKPTDIVLVLDQSGSMAESDMTVSDYTAYTNTTNSNLYSKGSNLWYKQGDSYVQATVTRTEGYNYQPYNGQTNETYYNNRNNLYAYVNGQLQQVTVKRSWVPIHYNYTYLVSGKTIAYSEHGDSTPTFSGIDGGKLYLRTSYYEYAYSYTDNGVKVPLGTSTGADAQFEDATLYQKTDKKITRLDALKTAATNFVNQIAQKAEAEGVDHRIAIVGFSSNDYDDGGTDFKNTEILTGCTVNNSNGVQYVAKPSSGTSNAYKNYISACGTALVTPQSAKAAINYLEADGGTETDKGMQMAKDILDNDSKKNDDRNRVVVLFTDGVPMIYSGYYGDSDSTITSRANRAINIANSICDKATVYTVGVFSGANGDISKGLPQNNGSWENGTNRPNRFMHLVSSNYPDATAMSEPGNVNSSLKNGDSYYLSAGDAATLNNIFEKIGNNISTPSIKLGSKAEVRDIVSPYFTAPTNANGITVYAEKAKYNGSAYTWTKDDSCTGMKATVSGQTVTVSGFDYDENFVSQTGRNEANPKESGDFHGRRLVVEFNVTVKPEFLGGNFVPTNLPTSGVYDENGNVVENFEYPRVNIPVKAPELSGESKNIYYRGTQLTASDLCTANIGAGMADYVDLSYSADKDISNTEDGNYIVTVTATPKYTIGGQEQQPARATGDATVTVFKPEVTYQDCTTNYGVAPEYSTANFVNAEWKNSSGTSASEAEMTGEEPELTYAYAPVDKSFTKDTYVNVTVSANGAVLPKGVVVFVHNDCTFSGCSNFDPTQGQFIVHINVFDLTIVKAAANGSEIDQNQTFVFHVKGNNNGVDMQVVITGDGQQTIKNLPMGSYTITEDTSWSWKYTPVDKNGEAAPSQTIAATGATTVTFENKNNGTNWLTSLAKAINTWAGGRAHEKTN